MWKVARKGSLEDEGVWEVGVSECRSVIDWIGSLLQNSRWSAVKFPIRAQ
jgi:hypothetical protein